jgi:hypothetical protein
VIQEEREREREMRMMNMQGRDGESDGGWRE